MLSKYVLCLALAAPMTLLLHGCGGGGDDPTPAPAPGPTPPGGGSTTPGPVTPAPAPAPPLPWDPATAVETLNTMYMGFDENDDESRLGVTISMAANTTDFNGNLFCSPLMNTSCYQGQADCRMSSTLFNHKVVVANNMFAPTMDRPVGYVFNQDYAENYFGKCSYLWDGNNFNDLNTGCGAGATGGNDCSNNFSAFYDQCITTPTEPHTCTRTDPEVEGRLCKCEPPLCAEEYGSVTPPATRDGETCFYELPALIYGASTTTNHLRDGLKQRIALQGTDGNATGTWNELVIDNRLLIPKIRTEPTSAILAFVCIPAQNPNACAMATAMRDKFHESYGVTGAGVPVVALDTTVDFTVSGGPFTVPEAVQVIA